MRNIYNFSAGPAVLPEPVLQEAADEMMDYKVQWSSFFVTFVAKKIMSLTVRMDAVSATLDSRPKGCRQIPADGDELRNRLSCTSAVGHGNVTSLWAAVKGMPLRYENKSGAEKAEKLQIRFLEKGFYFLWS